MKKIKKENAITLMSLVITIIVLLILAAISVSMLTGDNGILTQAAKSKKSTEKEAAREAIQIAIVQSNSDTSDKIRKEILEKNLKELLGEETELKSDKRGGYIVEQKGKTLGVIDENGELGEGNWHYSSEEGKDFVITDGETEMEIGDEINYDCKKDENGVEITESYISNKSINGYMDCTFNVKEYNGKWVILGAENGKILIKPMNETIGNLTLHSTTGYLNGINELNKISEIYGHGKGADGARSLKVEDADKITGYNPNNVGIKDLAKTGVGIKYGEGETKEYGKNVLYEKKEDGLYYNGIKGDSTKFNYFDERSWLILEKGESKSVISNNYEYYPETLTDIKDESQSVGIEHNSKVYKILFRHYWLASQCMQTEEGKIWYGMRTIDKSVLGFGLMESLGFSHVAAVGVCPVISLKPDIKISGNGTSGWIIE